MLLRQVRNVGAVLLLVVSTASAYSVLPPPQTGDLYVTDSGSDSILSISPQGDVSVAITTAEILAVTGQASVSFRSKAIAFDSLRNMYFTQRTADPVGPAGFYDAILKKSPGGLTMLTTDEQIMTATGAAFASPTGLAFGPDGKLYSPDDITDDGSVLRVDPVTGAVSVVVSHATLVSALGAGVDLEVGIVGTPGGALYGLSDGVPDTVFKIDAAGAVSVVADGAPFADLDVYMTRAPNGDLIVADNHNADTIHRVTPAGSVSTFLSKAEMEAVTGGTVDLEGGLAFDSYGNFYLVEENTDSILKFEPVGGGWTGSVWVSASDIQAVTGAMPILNGGIAFDPVPEPLTALAVLSCLAAVGGYIRKRVP